MGRKQPSCPTSLRGCIHPWMTASDIAPSSPDSSPYSRLQPSLEQSRNTHETSWKSAIKQLPFPNPWSPHAKRVCLPIGDKLGFFLTPSVNFVAVSFPWAQSSSDRHPTTLSFCQYGLHWRFSQQRWVKKQPNFCFTVNNGWSKDLTLNRQLLIAEVQVQCQIKCDCIISIIMTMVIIIVTISINMMMTGGRGLRPIWLPNSTDLYWDI